MEKRLTLGPVQTYMTGARSKILRKKTVSYTIVWIRRKVTYAAKDDADIK